MTHFFRVVSYRILIQIHIQFQISHVTIKLANARYDLTKYLLDQVILHLDEWTGFHVVVEGLMSGS